MKARDKFAAAFSPGGTAEIPVMICYENLFARDHCGSPLELH